MTTMIGSPVVDRWELTISTGTRIILTDRFYRVQTAKRVAREAINQARSTDMYTVAHVRNLNTRAPGLILTTENATWRKMDS